VDLSGRELVMAGYTRIRLLLIAVVAAMALGGPSAEATPASPASAEISHVRTDDGRVQFVDSVRGLTAGQSVDLSSIRVRAGGRTLHARAVTGNRQDSGAGTAQLPSRAAMLVMDVSGSMTGDSLMAAKRAALTYAKTLPADVEVGLVSFAERPALLLAPTADRSALRAAVARLRAGGSTALYDGVWTAVSAFRRESASGQRRVLVLSDGADTSSRHSLPQVAARLAASGTGMDAVGIGLSAPQRTVLRHLTAAGAGRLLPTSGLDQLDSAFTQAADTFSQQVTVTADVPPALAGKTVTVVATLHAAGHEVTATSTVDLPARAASSPASSRAAPTAGHRLPFVVLALTFLGLLALGLVLITPASRKPGRKDRLEDLDPYRWSAPSASSPDPEEGGRMATAALSLVDHAMRAGSLRSRTAAGLDRAGFRMRPQEWVLLRIVVAAAATAVLTLLTRSVIVGVLLGALTGWAATWAVLKVKGDRRSAAFNDQLPDVLQLVAGSLRSGFTLSQALEAVVREGDQPAAGELARALGEVRLGVPVEDALDQAANRVGCPDLEWVVMAVRISRDVGGNLSEVLLTTVRTMRERGQLRRQVRTLSAEGRLSGYVLVGLPILMAGLLMLIRPDYLRPLVTQPAGIVMLSVAVLGVLVGSWWMSRIVKVEI
jgi:Flp pilus assembly protein TadB/Mg-chelatase subunit ChlD